LKAILKYDRTIIAYHGCDAEVAGRILAGEPFRKSQNAEPSGSRPKD
jgi:hypothetical protein